MTASNRTTRIIGLPALAVIPLALMFGCSEDDSSADRPAKVLSPEVKEKKADLKAIDDEIERVEAALGLASDAMRPKLQGEMDGLKEKRREMKAEMKRLKGKGGDADAAAPDATSDEDG